MLGVISEKVDDVESKVDAIPTSTFGEKAYTNFGFVDSNEWVATSDKGFMVCYSFSNSQSTDGGLHVGINHANGSGEGATYPIGVGETLDGCIHGAPDESVNSQAARCWVMSASQHQKMQWQV
jgi:hypothetical protein